MNGAPEKRDGESNPSTLAAFARTQMAWLRTRMSLETTLAAWVRTATSLIGFGFAIVQFLEHFGRFESGGQAKGPHLGSAVGLVLIGAGSLTTMIAIWEYRRVLKYLESGAFRDFAGVPTMRRPPPDVAVWMAVLLAFVVMICSSELR